MINLKRKLMLDLCDFSGNKLISLYDNSIEQIGAAVDIVVMKQRNGWKELSFDLPYEINTENGIEKNPRVEYLKSDYKIRLEDDYETDWYIISEPKISHDDYTKTYSVTAGHVSQILKTKNLNLEFSDDEGNNVGTAKQLLDTILDGTGWTSGTVANFYEKDGTTIKVRSLTASTKTGAFSLITKMCDLFDAKPIFYGATKKVNIVPMNPFSDPAGGLPEVSDGDVVEFNYGVNLKSTSRTLNSENIVTKLYAYGSYGDDTTGYCGIDEVEHKEFRFTGTALQAETEYRFDFVDDYGTSCIRYFTPTNSCAGSDAVYSLMDPASLLYVWDETNEKAYHVYDERQTQSPVLISSMTSQTVVNNFSFIMDFDYYYDEGFISDEMLQKIAQYQRKVPALLETTKTASTLFNDKMSELRELVGVVDFCRLDVSSYGSSGGYATLTLRKTTYSDGIMYRTDYDEKKDDQFKWRVATEIDDKGDPVNSGASVVYIVHNTSPATWEKVALKAIDDEDDPGVLTLWCTSSSLPSLTSTDRIYLFQTDDINGYLGAYESSYEAMEESVASATKVITVNHPLIFSTSTPTVPSVYSWWYKYSNSMNTFGELYFCYAENGETSWNRVYVNRDTLPSGVANAYCYLYSKSKLYKYVNSTWTLFETVEEKRIANAFSSVLTACHRRDKYMNGIYEKLKYTVSSGSSLTAGDYYMNNGYDSFYLFTTTSALSAGDVLSYDTTKQYITATISQVDSTIEAQSYTYDNVSYHSSNILSDCSLEDGGLNNATGEEITLANNQRTSFIRCYPNIHYDMSGFSSSVNICFYNEKNVFLSSTAQTTGFDTPNNTYYVRMSTTSISKTSNVVRYTYYDSAIIAEDKTYNLVTPLSNSGTLKGILSFISNLRTLPDTVFLTCKAELDAAQAAVTTLENQLCNSLGDLVREGYMQKSDYVDGDEDKLFDDAIESLKKISRPEAEYDISYIDLFEVKNADSDNDYNEFYPDIKETMAVHLIDADINIDEWAFIDTIKKCYDQPWKTQVTINTNLTTISQHTFTDVMTHIANVASELNAKQTKFDKSVIPSSNGKVAADILQGQIDANSLMISGGNSTWYTDKKGNIVFESADGERAMMLSGSGFAIANSKNAFGEWNYRTFGTGDGFTADEIMTGILRAGAVTILGSDQFYWDENNIYIINPSDTNKQIRIGQYDFVNYGIGITTDNGETWQHAIDFSGVHFGHISDIEGLEARLSLDEANIAAKVSQTEFDELGETVASHTSSISQQATEIATKVSQSDLTTALSSYSTITQTAESISTAVSNISIGGANMLAGSSITNNIIYTYAADQDTNPVYKLEHGDDYPDKWVRLYRDSGVTSDFCGVFVCSDIVVGKQYTFSADVVAYNDYVKITSLGATTTEWVLINNSINRLSVTFTCTSSDQHLEIWLKYNGGSNVLDIRKVKLEEGNKATSWCPSTDNMEIRMSSAESSITQQATQIASKVSQSDFNALGTRVSSAESSITQQATQIASKVSQSDFDTLGNRVSSAESTISQQATEIATKVSQSDLTSTLSNYSTLTQTATSITAAVKNIDINPNLISNSENPGSVLAVWTNDSSHPVAGYAFTSDTNGRKTLRGYYTGSAGSFIRMYVQYSNLVIGRTYTFSASVTTYGTTQTGRIGTDENFVSFDSIANERMSSTFTATATSRWLCVDYFGEDYLDVWDVKLEAGSEATPWCYAENLTNGSITIDTNGIAMTGGTIDMQAGTAFKVKSGGTVQIDASSADNSYINLGDGNFAASKAGGVTASSGSFGSLNVGGKKVLTEDDVGTQIIVSTTQPSGHNIVWLQPSSVTSLKYTAYTAASRDSTINFAATNPITRTFTATTSDTLSGSKTFSITVPLFSVSATVSNFSLYAQITDGSATETTNTVSASITPYNTSYVTLTITTSNFSGVSSLSVSFYGNYNGGSGSVYIQKDTTLELTASQSGGSGTQSCNIYYVP